MVSELPTIVNFIVCFRLPGQLLEYLFQDIMELKEELNDVKAQFSTSKSVLELRLEDETSVESPVFFLRNLDPNLINFDVALAEKVQASDLDNIVRALTELSKKVCIFQTNKKN